MKRTTLVVIEHAPHGRAIPEHDLSRLVLDARFARHRQTRRVKGAVRSAPVQIAPCSGLGRRHCGAGCLRRLVCLRCRVGRARDTGSGLTAILQHPSCDGAQPSHCAPHLDLRTTVQLQHRLGHIAEPLGLDTYIGLPPEQHSRVATLLPMALDRLPPGFQLDEQMQAVVATIFDQSSLTFQVFTNPPVLAGVDEFNSAEMRGAEWPAANGITTARSLSKLYGELACDRVLSPATLDAAETAQVDGPDRVLVLRTRFGLGFALPSDIVTVTSRSTSLTRTRSPAAKITGALTRFTAPTKSAMKVVRGR